MLGVPGSIPGRVVDQLVRALAGWARWLVPCLGSPVQPQAGSLHMDNKARQVGTKIYHDIFIS